MTDLILPNTNPFIVTYPDYTNLFFAFGDHPEIRDWLISRAIGLLGIWTPETYGILINFYDSANPWYCTPADACPYITTQHIDESILFDMNKEFISFLISQIERENYIYLYVDHFELSCFGDYKKSHYNHGLLIYGFDLNKELLLVAGFINGRGYERRAIPFQEFASSFFNKTREADKQVSLFRYNSNSEMANGTSYCSYLHSYNTSKAYLSNELSYYLVESRYTTYPNVYMGIEVYDLYKHYCMYLSETSQRYIYKQPLQVMYEHKKILNHVINQLFDDTFIPSAIQEDIDSIIHGVLLCRNCMLKYCIANKPERFKLVTPLLDEMKRKEYSLFDKLTECGLIKSFNNNRPHF